MKLFVLDTDILTLHQHGHADVCHNVAQHDAEDLAVSVISVEEQLSGWYSVLRKSKSDHLLALAYEHLTLCVESLADLRILTFDEASIERFHNLRASRIPIRNPDLKIAATVLQCDGTLVTRNTRDFAQVPGLRFVDWSIAAKT